MRIPQIDLKAQYQGIKSEIDPVVAEIIANATFIGGPPVAEFERQFATYCEAQAAVGAASGTAALHLALCATGIEAGEEVITVSQTFIATAEVARLCGATVKMVDIDPLTYCMDPQAFAAAITPRTRVVIPVDLYGHPADMDAIAEVAAARGIQVIEDAAQAHGARYRGRRAGSLAPLATFSFYPGKNLGAYGDAGAVTLADPAVADRVAQLANHGRSEKYEHAVEGFNYRLDALQAAVLTVKLKHLDEWNAARRKVAARYRELLSEVSEVTLPGEADGIEHVYHLFVIQVAERDRVAAALRERGVMVQLHYPIPLHLQPAYAHLKMAPGALPATEEVAAHCISLPVFPEMTAEQIGYVVETLKDTLAKVAS